MSEVLFSVTGEVFDIFVKLRLLIRLDEGVDDTKESFAVINSHALLIIIILE